jgi:formylmethanofuran dehydrogenase subunit C
MTKVTLKLRKPIDKPLIPIEAENIAPDIFAGKTLEEINQLIIWRGNKKITLSDVFEISGDDLTEKSADQIEIAIADDIPKYKRIGQQMTAGKITIHGSVGMHLGFQMAGGKIEVFGHADDFAGANMTAGEIIIHQNAGHYLGGSYRGDWQGMKGGKILVKGNVKNECGIWMRNGLIEIEGDAQMFLGMHLHKGTIIVHGAVESRAGAEMTGGEIIITGKLLYLLPSFEFQKEITNLTIKNHGTLQGTFLVFKGDFAERKQGHLYLLKSNNNHLL